MLRALEAIPAKSITALSSYPFQGRQPWLKPQQQAAFKQSLSDDSMATLAQAAERIKQQTGIDYTISGTWVALKRMGIKKKTGRPSHVHHDETAAAAFKKAPALIASFGKRCFFEDEMRSGTRNECKRRYRQKGSRPLCKIKLGYEYCYLYAALQPFEGHLISVILPDMIKQSFTVFMKYFKQATQSLYGRGQRCC